MSAGETVTWTAPGRVNLIGEHTDYNDGYVLPFALAQRTTVTARRLDRPEWIVSSAELGETVSFGEQALTVLPGVTRPVTGWAAYVAGVVWALREAGYPVSGAALEISSQVPVGAGLSSSAALESAVLGALCELSGLPLERAELPALAQRAENHYVGVPCGIMDQSASLLAEAGHALFLDCRTQATEQVPLAAPILVIDTRAPHRLVDGAYAERRASCELAAKILGVPALRDVTDLDDALAVLHDPAMRRRVRHVVTENSRVLQAVQALRNGDLPELGRLLTESHVSLRDDYQVTVPELDSAVESALSAGALGARMTGGGFGGCVLALLPTAAAAPTVAAQVEMAFAKQGFTAPTWFIAVPSAGAGRTCCGRSLPGK